MHIGLVIFTSTANLILETAIEYYATKSFKSNLGHYSKHQIDNISESGKVIGSSTYAAKVKGYLHMRK